MTSRAGVIVREVHESAFLNQPEQELFFPAGLLGFGSCHQYKLERFKPDDGSESPFFMLCARDQDLSFPLIHPESISLEYRFPVTPELLTALDATSPDELVPLLIVTVRDRLEEITVNLQGPVIVNPASSLGLQLVIEQYPVRRPLLQRAES
jgi:flagellar assembly factor FliW